jgi:hypothetical protein
MSCFGEVITAVSTETHQLIHAIAAAQQNNATAALENTAQHSFQHQTNKQHAAQL